MTDINTSTSHTESHAVSRGRGTKARPTIEQIPLLAVDAEGFAAMIGVSAATIKTWGDSALIPAPCRVGGRVFWPTETIRRWVSVGCPCREKFELIQKGTR